MHTASTYTCCSTATVPWRLHVQPPQMIMPAGKLAISCCRARFLTAAQFTADDHLAPPAIAAAAASVPPAAGLIQSLLLLLLQSLPGCCHLLVAVQSIVAKNHALHGVGVTAAALATAKPAVHGMTAVRAGQSAPTAGPAA